MKLIQKSSEKVVISEEIDESLANAIRRFANEIPIVAVDEVEIMKNDSALYDETLAHRIALVPLKQIKSKKDIVLKLQVKKEGTVYSSEMKGEADPVYGGIPLVVLNKGQELEIVCYARLGKGKEHAKFSPGLIFYREESEIKETKDKSKGEVYFPRHGEVDKRHQSDLVDEFVEMKGKGLMKVVPNDNLIIEIESFGQIPASEIFTKAIGELRSTLEDVEKDLK